MNREPLATMRAFFTAAASTIVLSIFSFTVRLQRQVLLLGDRDPVFRAMLANEYLDQVGDRAVVSTGGGFS